MHLGAVRSQRQRLLRSCPGSLDLCVAVIRRVRHVAFPRVGVGEADQRLDIVIVEPQRGLEKAAGSPGRLERQIPIPGGSAEKGVIDRVETAGTLARRSAALRRDHLYVDGPGQSGGDLVLHVEKIAALLVEAFGPQTPAALGINELRVEADPFARVLHAAFENIAYAELAADLAGVDRLALICKSGVARDREDA